MFTKAISPTYAQYLLSQQDLFGRILNFNQQFHARQRELLAQKPQEEISDTLFNLHPELAKFHSEHNISYCFENAADRLCLIRLNELDQLVVFLGACISAPQLARVSAQDDLNTVYAQIGRKIYNFALDYGYLIKSFDYEPDLNSLKDDCTYLGLCALKCLQSLFSSKELQDFFINLLISYTQSRKLNPAIITSETHILNVIEANSETLHAPSPIQMNTPVQYTAIDLHPSLDKHTPQALPETTEKKTETKPPLSLEITKPTLYEPEPHRQLYAPFAQVPSKIPVGAFIKNSPNTPQKVSLSTLPPQATSAAAPAAASTAAPAAAAPKPAAATSAASAAATTKTTSGASAPTEAGAATTAGTKTPTPDNLKSQPSYPADNSDLPPTVGAPLPTTYESAALYGSPNSKERRMFRSVSLQQQNVHQELLQPKAEPQALIHNQLVTLEFNATQVFTLTKLILESQIDENWYEYLI